VRGGWAGRLGAAALAGLLAASFAGSVRAADGPPPRETVLVGAGSHAGYSRVTFTWKDPATAQATVSGTTLTLHFARPFEAGLDAIARRLPDLVEGARFGDDHETVVISLKKPVTAETFAFGTSIAVDLRLPPDPDRGKAAADQAPDAPDPVHLAAAARPNGGSLILTSRDAFDATLAQKGQEVTIALPRALAAGGLAALASLKPRLAEKTVSLTLPEGAKLTRSGGGRRIVIDVAEPAALPAAGDTKPAPAQPASPAPAAAKPATPEPAKAEDKKPEDKKAAEKPPATAPTAAAKPADNKPSDTKAAEKKPRIWLAVDKGRDGRARLVLGSPSPFEAALEQKGRTASITLNGSLGAPRSLAAIADLNPEVTDTALSLTLPEGKVLQRSNRPGRVTFELVPAPPTEHPAAAAAAATPPAASPSVATPSVATRAGSLATAPRNPANPPAAPALVAAPASVKTGPILDGISLRFAPIPATAAVFRRGRALWVAFDGAATLDLTELRAHAPEIEAANQVPSPSGTVLRLQIAEGLEPSLRQADSEWIVDLQPHPATAETPLAPQTAGTPPHLHFATEAAAAPISVTDPEIGDALVIVPVRETGQGVAAEQDLVDVQVLPTIQGFAFAPRSDGVKIAAAPDGVDVTSADGLLISATSGGPRFRERRDRVFDPAAWAGEGDMLANRRALEQAIVDAKPEGRTWPRINLARFFIAAAYGPEARGVIAAIEHDDPSAMRDPSLRALRGVSLLLSDDLDAAAPDLATPLIEGDRDLALWQGALLYERGEPEAGAAAFEQGLPVLKSYPRPLRNRLSLDAAGAKIATGHDDDGLLETVLGQDPTQGQRLQALFLQGRMLANHGQVDAALHKWDEVAGGNDRASRARALFARTELQLRSGRIDRPTAIDALDQLRFSWRGGPFEFALLRRIGRLKIEDGDYRGGLASLREASVVMPNHPQAKALEQELKQAFSDVFLGPRAASIPPMKALAVYDEYKDLMPQGEQADAIIRKLADRLAAVDLLDRAAALLDEQAKTRLAGLERARVATRDALLRLLDRKPEQALAALDIPVDQSLPPELATQRSELRARALLDLGKAPDALAALNADATPAADKLRAEIAVKTQNWPEAAKVFARLAGDPPAAQPLSEEAARAVLNEAVALTLAKDHDGVAALRDKYEAAMAQTRFKDGFRIVAGADTAGASDMRELTSRLAQVSDLQSFMANYRRMVAHEDLSAIN